MMDNIKMSKNKPIFLLTIIFFLIIVANFRENKIPNTQSDVHSYSNIANYPNAAESHDPIYINGNAELAAFIVNEGLTGNGTFSSPYIIENFNIDASTTHGIRIWNTDKYLIIRNCTIQNGISSNYYGIHFSFIKNINISNNEMINNYGGIATSASSNITIYDNYIYNNLSGININDCRDTNIIENSISYCVNSGINSHGPNNNFSGNTIHNCKYGIVMNGVNNNCSGNIVMYNSVSGIYMASMSENNTIFRNRVYKNEQGIWMGDSSEYNVFSENIVDNNLHGFYMRKTSNNILSGNNASNNIHYGIIMYESSNNIIYFNDFYNNGATQATEDSMCSDNQWDNGTTGNYWGDHYLIKNPDAKNNGTHWDTPYVIDGYGSGVDNFPLVNSATADDENKSKIPGFPTLHILIFISVGAFLLSRKTNHHRI